MSGECEICGEHALECESTTYFMTKMTQEEFENKCKDKHPQKYEFNKIKSVKSFKESID